MEKPMSADIRGLSIAPVFIRAHRTADPGLVRRLAGGIVRRWQHRRTIAAMEAMEDWVLRDIGLDRADIPGAVAGLTDRELRMNPLAQARDRKSGRDPACRRAA